MLNKPVLRSASWLLAALLALMLFFAAMWLTLGCRGEMWVLALYGTAEPFMSCVTNERTLWARTVAFLFILASALTLAVADWYLFEKGRKPSERAGVTFLGLDRPSFRKTAMIVIAGLMVAWAVTK